MNIIVHDPYLDESIARRLGVKKVDSREELYKDSDIVSYHLPLKDDTKGLLNKTLLLHAKPNVKIVNVGSKGAIVVAQDLADFLRANPRAAYYGDVWEKEPVFVDDGEGNTTTDNPLLHLELKGRQVWGAPHLGAEKKESKENVAKDSLETVVQFLKTGTAPNIVNFAALTKDKYIKLASSLGEVAYQLFLKDSGYNKLSVGVILHGELADEKQKSTIEKATISGLLKQIDGGVTIDNAVETAQRRGVSLEISEDTTSYKKSTRLGLELKVDDKAYFVAASIDDESGVLKLRAYEGSIFEGPMKGHTYLIRQDASQGSLAKITSHIAAHGANLQYVTSEDTDSSNGKKDKVGIIFLQTGKPLTEEALTGLKGLPVVYDVKEYHLN
jgi:D-3-phosphoglycerate dehydrogenase / 2-oxoglutarate reductase